LSYTCECLLEAQLSRELFIRQAVARGRLRGPRMAMAQRHLIHQVGCDSDSNDTR